MHVKLSPSTLRHVELPLDENKVAESPVVTVNTDELEQEYMTREKQVLYTPTKSTCIPCALLFFSTLICLTLAITSYFLADASAKANTLSGLMAVAEKGQYNVQSAINSTRIFVNSVNALFTVLDGQVDVDSQFIPFVFADDGFPSFMQRLYYTTYVSDKTNFTLAMRAKGSSYANFTIGTLDSHLNIIPYPWNFTKPFYFPVTHASHPSSVIGFDHFSDPVRAPIIDKAMLTKTMTSSSQLIAADGVTPVLILYSPVYSRSQKLLGLVAPLFKVSNILTRSLIDFGDAYASVIDLNETNPDTAFMYNTIQYRGDDSLATFTAAQNRDMIQNSYVMTNCTLQFADRTWMLTFIPTTKFVNTYRRTVNRWIGSIIAVCLWIISIAFCIFLIFFRRLKKSVKDRQASEVQIAILSKFLPLSFMSLIRVKSVRNVKPGSHRHARVTLMSISIDNYDQLSGKKNDEIMTMMNKVFVLLKNILAKHNGFIYRFEGLSFLALFANETDALVAANDIVEQTILDIQVHVAMHSCTIVAGILGDNENLLSVLITDQIDCLKRLSILSRTHQAKIIMTREVLEGLKKSIEKSVAFIGRVDTSVNGVANFTDAYQLVDTKATSKPGQRRLGLALKKFVLHDYLGALDLLQALTDTEVVDSRVKRLYEMTSRTVMLCLKMSDVWSVHDSLGNDILRPAFERFCGMESSLPFINAWRDAKEYKCLQPIQRRQKATDMVKTYCSDDSMQLREGIVKLLKSKLDTDVFNADLLDDILPELERLSTEAHTRFTKTPTFLNGMYSIMINKG
jgi:CHASE1-domain containing sensor protein/class 3 adenylate cyclase